MDRKTLLSIGYILITFSNSIYCLLDLLLCNASLSILQEKDHGKSTNVVPPGFIEEYETDSSGGGDGSNEDDASDSAGEDNEIGDDQVSFMF